MTSVLSVYWKWVGAGPGDRLPTQRREMSTNEAPTKIQHLTYVVPPKLMGWETEFWKAIGFGRLTRPEPKIPGQWLNGGGIYVHLKPTLFDAILNEVESHVAIIPRFGMKATIDALERLPFRVVAEAMGDWWGSERVLVHSPAGYAVELLAVEPPTVWTEAPPDD